MPNGARYEPPSHRPLRIFAFDPMLGRRARNRVTIPVAHEALLPGPQGSRLQVIDYDAVNQVLYHPVDLDDPAVLMNDGLAPSISDPRFHQQMVYAVAMKVVDNFERALGRRLMFRDRHRRRRRLRLYPHGFQGSNAFYDPELVAVLFGYFRADKEDPGSNIPNQTVFSCLSHDIIAHEVTHALVDRLRPHFLEASNRDVLAFHEAFADIVAIFQHFSFPTILAEAIQTTGTALRSAKTLGSLAMQFGHATGQGRALRSAVEQESPDPRLFETVIEPHERGSILVAAVFDAFFTIYRARIRDLVRIATGGTGRLPEGDLHPDLVNRIEHEAAKTAQHFLNMCVRAFDYLPPVDITFGDFLRAIVTTDRVTVPDDEHDLRATLIESFRERGIIPAGVDSLAEESLVWEDHAPENIQLPFVPFREALVTSAQAFDRGPEPIALGALASEAKNALDGWAALLRPFAKEKWALLRLNPKLPIDLGGLHVLFGNSPDGRLRVELVAQFIQEDTSSKEDPAFGGTRILGGTTVIASAQGIIRHVIAKPISYDRREEQRSFVERCDREDAMLAWAEEGYEAKRMQIRNFARLHNTRPRAARHTEVRP